MEGLTLDVLHDQDRSPWARCQIVHTTHIGMADRPCVQHLLTKRFVVAGLTGILTNDLQRNHLLGAPVVREEHLSHSSLAEALADLVTIVDVRTALDWLRCSW